MGLGCQGGRPVKDESGMVVGPSWDKDESGMVMGPSWDTNKGMIMARENLFYYEHYPHMSGTYNAELKLDIAEMDKVSDLYLKDKEEGFIHLEEEMDLPGYAWGDILEGWPKIRKALEKVGEWSGEWEEGSHAISMTNMKDARALVGKIEAKVFERCGEW